MITLYGWGRLGRSAAVRYILHWSKHLRAQCFRKGDKYPFHYKIGEHFAVNLLKVRTTSTQTSTRSLYVWRWFTGAEGIAGGLWWVRWLASRAIQVGRPVGYSFIRRTASSRMVPMRPLISPLRSSRRHECMMPCGYYAAPAPFATLWFLIHRNANAIPLLSNSHCRRHIKLWQFCVGRRNSLNKYVNSCCADK